MIVVPATRTPHKLHDDTVEALPPLRVVVVVGSTTVHAWVAEIVRDLDASPRFDVAVSTVDPVTPRTSVAFRLYEKLDAALFRQRPDALAESVLPDSAIQRVAEPAHCDVLLAMAPIDVDALAPTARFGVWAVSHADTNDQPSEPLLFWESARREVVETRLEAIFADGDRRVLYTSFGATDTTSLHRGRNRALWKAKGAVLRQLEAVDALRDAHIASLPSTRKPTGVRPRSARSYHVLGFAARAGVAALRRRIRRVLWEEPWFIAVRTRPTGSPFEPATADAGFRRIDPPPGKAFADPMSLEEGGRTYVFFEEYDNRQGRARISFVVLDEMGRTTDEPTPVLDTGFHLSYPFVFRRDEEIFMIPESSADETVTLYRAVDFPSRWTAERVLLSSIRAVDATLLEHNDSLWLFAAVGAPGASLNDELHLFLADELEGPWTPHPANPIASDVRNARPAGRIFRHGGALIRPAQDCSLFYGRAVVLNRIDVLTPDDYRETPVASIPPIWDVGLAATHTYTVSDRIELVDGRRPVRRSRHWPAWISRRRRS